MNYQHYKTGGIYEVITEDAIIEATLERAVVYKSVKSGEVWVRPYGEFHGYLKNDNGEIRKRFSPTSLVR